jgi:uncharacterized repeat protein (TIGR03943 family)
MKPTPIMTRQFLFTCIYLIWCITLLSLILSGGYRSFLRPSFVIFLWGAIAILLVFIFAGIRDRGNLKIRFADMVRGGVILLPLVTLWIANGKPLGTYAYMKKTMAASGVPLKEPSETAADTNSGSKLPVQRRHDESAPIPATILELIKQPHRYLGKLIVTEGMALRQDTFRKDAPSIPGEFTTETFMLFRFRIICCVADSQPLGLIVKYAEAPEVVDNDWYRVTGYFHQNREKIGIIRQATVSNLETPPEPPYLFENLSLR